MKKEEKKKEESGEKKARGSSGGPALCNSERDAQCYRPTRSTRTGLENRRIGSSGFERGTRGASGGLEGRGIADEERAKEGGCRCWPIEPASVGVLGRGLRRR